MKGILELLFMTILINASFAQDKCQSIGWANCDGQTYVGPPTGGGNVSVTQVTTFAQLKAAAESSDPKVIHVMNDVGNGYKGTTGDVLNVNANKTIIGVKPDITVKCSWQIGAANVIVRNLICRGPGNSNSEQNWDCVNISGSAKRIWFDHCTIMEGEDGNFDVVKGADNVTVTWCKFTYVTVGSHNLSNLIGSSDNEPVSHGKLNITYAYCWWDNVNSRTPRSRYGMIHVLNCYYSNSGGTRAGFMANQRMEGCYFDNIISPIGLISPGGKSGIFVLDCHFVGESGSSQSEGGYTVFTPPYTFDKFVAKDVKSIVTNPDCGAGPTMKDPVTCGCSVAKPTDCAGVEGGTATKDNCDRCVDGTTGKTACISTGEIETDACSYDGAVESDNAGFKGMGYINVPNAIGSQITFNLNSTSAGTKTISFRYANGGTADRNAQILVNEVSQFAAFAFPATTSFTTYGTVEIALNLISGNNVIQLVANTADGLANIDQIGYVSTGLSKGDCVVTGLEGTSVDHQISIYPNPSKTSFYLNTSKSVDFQVINMDGKVCEEYKNVMNLEFGKNLKPGIYFLKTENKVYKMVKD